MTFTKIYVIIITENKKGIDYMKKYTFSYGTRKTENSYQVEIPENVVEFKVCKISDGIFLQYVTESDRKNNWATDVLDKNFRRLKAFYFDELLGLSFVKLTDGRFGFSKCSKNDKFDPIIGRAVAICHAMEEKIPDFI